jgi:signal transduction histidine kinase
VVGVASPLVAAATLRVERRWREEASPDTDGEVVAGLLAAIARAADERRPSYVADLVPRPSPALGHRLVDMLRAELIRGWSEAPRQPAGSSILNTLIALEQVRTALDASAVGQFEALLDGRDGLELVVELAHDLRSPLTSILFLAETLQNGQSGEVNELQHRQLGLIYGAALGLSAVVSDAIELVQGSDALADKELTPFSVTELMHSVRDIVRPLAEEKGLELRVLPPDGDHRLGQPLPLSRVLLNLTTNALKFTREGVVDIQAIPQGATRMQFAVRDSGPGINPESLRTLFRPFRPARGRRGYCFSDTGLGLAISRKLITAMGSELRLETRPQWGTRFSFELELPPAPTARPPRMAGAADRPQTWRAHGRRVDSVPAPAPTGRDE